MPGMYLRPAIGNGDLARASWCLYVAHVPALSGASSAEKRRGKMKHQEKENALFRAGRMLKTKPAQFANLSVAAQRARLLEALGVRPSRH